MEKGFAIILVLACWGGIFWLIFKGIKSTGSIKASLLSQLLKNKKITKEQYLAIDNFEKKQKINRWKKEGFITEEQADRILNPPSKKSISFVTSLLYLAVGCIVIGVIALIAANYDKIPPMVRLMTTFILFVCSTMGAYDSYIKKKTLYMEVLLATSIGLIGALIGLVAQTFHLSGPFPNAVFLWTVLALPFAVISTKKYFAFAWYPLFTFFFFASSFGERVFRFLSENLSLPSCLIIGLIVGLSIYQALKKYASTHPFTEALKSWGIIYAVGSVILIDSIFSEKHSTFILQPKQKIWSALLLVAAFIHPFIQYAQKRFVRNLLIFLFGFGLASSFVFFPFMGIIFTLTILSFGAFYFAYHNQLKAFNLTVALIFGRIIFAYFYLFMSLATTGISAIILGVLILSGLYIWKQQKQNLINYIQKGK